MDRASQTIQDKAVSGCGGNCGDCAISQRMDNAASTSEELEVVASSGAGRALPVRHSGVAGGVSHILLPWPPRAVHPNARTHWAQKARATKRMRHDAAWAAKSAGLSAGGPVHVSLTFYPPDKRRRDLDGCISSCKAYLDGLADALGVDDSRFTLSARMSQICSADGEVKIEVSKPLTDDEQGNGTNHCDEVMG